MRMTHNTVLVRKLIDKLSRDVMRKDRKFENVTTAQQLLTVLEEEARKNN